MFSVHYYTHSTNDWLEQGQESNTEYLMEIHHPGNALA